MIENDIVPENVYTPKMVENYSVYEVFKFIRRRPEQVVGRRDLTDIYIFLKGYFSCYNDLTNKKEVALPGFQEFIQTKFQEGPGQNWARIITNNSEDKDVFTVFFELVHEFYEGKEVPKGLNID